MNKKYSHKFVIIGHEGSHNRGCEALVRTTVQMIREHYPQSLICLVSKYPEHEVVLSDIQDLIVVPGISVFPHYILNSLSPKIGVPSERYNIWKYIRKRIVWLNKIFDKIIPRIIKRIAKKIIPGYFADNYLPVPCLENVYKNADAVIVTGGDIFYDDYGPPLLEINMLELAHKLGIKTVIWGFSIWPQKDHSIRKKVLDMLAKVDLIMVRDDATYNYLRRAGLEIKRVADGAFLMAPDEKAPLSLPAEHKDRLVIGFNGSSLMFGQHIPCAKHAFVTQELVRYFQYLIDNENVFIVFVPHDGYPASSERGFLWELATLINRPDMIYIPEKIYNAPETKALVGKCSCFIAMRFHASIAAMSQGIPTIGLSYSPKFAGLHELVYGHKRFLLDYESIAFDGLLGKFDCLLKNGNEVKVSLKKRIAELKSQAELSGNYFRQLVG